MIELGLEVDPGFRKEGQPPPLRPELQAWCPGEVSGGTVGRAVSRCAGRSGRS